MSFNKIKSLPSTTAALTFFAVVISVSMLFLLLEGINKISELANFTQKIYQHPLAVSNAVQLSNSNIISMHRYMKDVSLSRTDIELNSALEKVSQGEKNVLLQLSLIHKRYLGDNKEIAKLRRKFIGWNNVRQRVINSTKNKNYNDAAKITKNEGAIYVQNLIDDLNDILLFAKNKASHFLSESEKKHIKSKEELIFIGFTILFINLIFLVSIIFKINSNHKKLQDRQEQFRSAFENTSIANIVINSQGLIEVYNSTAHSIFGYTEEEVIGKNVKILMPEKFKTNHDHYLQRYLDTKEAHIIGVGREVVGKRKNGDEFPMHLGIGEMNVANKTLFVASIKDLTDIKKLERQLQKKQRSEIIGQLAGGIAHDYNNLLAVMMGNIELALKKIDTDNLITKNLNHCLTAINKAASLTQQLLSYSGQQNLRPSNVEIGIFINNASNFLIRTLPDNIIVETNISKELLNIFIDQAAINNMFINLAFNSRDAMPNGGTISITNTKVKNFDFEQYFDNVKDGNYVCIEFHDTGCGIEQNNLTHIFEPFYTTKEIGQGSGLGLSMVYGFIQQSNGYIRIESRVNKGTDILIYLPLIDSDDDHINDLKQPKFNFHLKTILLVEDDIAVAETTATILKELGYDVITTHSASSALELLEGNGSEVRLVISDVVMPGDKNGIELAQEIKRKYKLISILLISGYPEDIAKRELLAKENLLLLTKPFSQLQLMQAVNEAAEGTNWQIK